MIDKFKAFFKDNEPVLECWGNEVIDQIRKALSSKNINADVFLKISGKRVKEEHSALSKIVRKNYTDPLTQMTDLVGARFVVLLTDDLNTLQEIIENSEIWDASKDKDYLDAIENNPELFDYQSIHYVVRSKKVNYTDALGIPEGLPCEIQIRTLLQHAYAELTHDNVYKPSIPNVPYQARRLIARSMALMESTDELFCKTIVELDKSVAVRNELYEKLLKLYNATISPCEGVDYLFNVELLDCYQDKFNNDSFELIETLVAEKTYLPARIQDRRKGGYLNQQPVILFVYWLVSNNPREIQKSWPYNSLDRELSSIYSDLGIAMSSAIH
jgi:putative GTP pyrophosphokinase